MQTLLLLLVKPLRDLVSDDCEQTESVVTEPFHVDFRIVIATKQFRHARDLQIWLRDCDGRLNVCSEIS